MTMHCSLTLNFIRENWCAATASMDRRSFCREILPDSYDWELCSGQGDHFLNPESGACLMDQTLMGLMRGNRKSLKNLTVASVAFTKDFQQKLAHNTPIRYRDPDRAPGNTVENMLGKLRRLIRRFCAPVDRNHMLFTHMDLSPLGEGPEGVEYSRMQLVLEMLLERETETALTYALFLMIVTAILQNRLATVQHLYSPEAVERILAADEEAPVLEVEGHNHVPFTDPNYMHSYHIHFYRDTPGKYLWEGELVMQLNESGTRAVASMTLHSRSQSPISGETELLRVFRGVPMLSRRDHVVYIGMTDERNTFAFLSFSYMRFNFTPMYFRSGILVSSAPETKYPIAQRVAIVARKLEEEEMPYVRGLLKTGGRQVILTEAQYRLFLENFRDYPWMPDFEAHYAPLFEAHKKTVYCFRQEELMAWSIGDLSQEDRLRILLALRSVDNPSDRMQDKFLESAPPTRTHAIMK
jgi:hypothetical protein